MAVTKEKIEKVKQEMYRLKEAIEELESSDLHTSAFFGNQYTARVKRASMDLTRVLAQLRSSND